MQETVSFIKLIENRIKVGWNNPSICDYGEKAYTYGDVAKSIAQLHIIYSKAGIAKGDKIAMCGSNSSRWGIVFISALTYGAVPVPVLPDFQSDQIQNIVNLWNGLKTQQFEFVWQSWLMNKVRLIQMEKAEKMEEVLLILLLVMRIRLK